VFTLGAENRVNQRLVKTGRTLQGQTEITDGLDATAQVVASGGGFLNDGDTVQVVTGAKP
jgi:hypothetical protein